MAILAVLHTWSRALVYHPHVHCLVPAGGLAKDGTWHPARKSYLVPVAALSVIFRARFMALARKALPEETFPETLWDNPLGGLLQTGVTRQRQSSPISRTLYPPVAITNRRIKAIHNGKVTFDFKDTRNSRWKTMTLPAEEFIRRFLQHVLPKGFHKVRYDLCRARCKRIRLKHLQYVLAEP